MSKGFSKYDINGNVIYSMSTWQGVESEHYYAYDSLNRRIKYERIDYDKSKNIIAIYKEYISYSNTTKTLYTYNNIMKIINIKVYNNSGRMISEKIIDSNGCYTYREFNQYTKKYTSVTGRDLFYYTWN